MKVTLLKSVTYSIPVLDGNKKPVKERVKFNGRDIEVNATDNVHAEAGNVIDVTKDVGKGWIDSGIAREFEPVLDIDPTDPLA